MTAARAPMLVAVAAAIAGVGISIYLTVVHYSAAPLVCSSGGLVNCERVLTSPYGVIAGTSIPTAAAGIVWFIVAAGLAGWRLAGAGGRWRDAHLAWAAIGLATVLGLVYIEINRLGAVCAWCTGAHVCVVVTVLAVVWDRTMEG